MTGESLQRQVAGLVRGQRGQAAAFGEVQAMTDDRGLDVQVMLRRVAGEHPVDPVSYTHLDVYKRQV